MKKKRLEIKDKLIISIDVSKKNDVISLCKRINNKVTTLKLGLEVIYSTGFNIVETVKGFGYKILLDLKLLDMLLLRHQQKLVRILLVQCSQNYSSNY